MEEAHIIKCLAWAIGLVMVIIRAVIWDNTMFWIGVVIWSLIFAMRGLECILKFLPKLRVQDSSPTNSRTTDEGTNWTITTVVRLNDSLVPGLNQHQGVIWPAQLTLTSRSLLAKPKNPNFKSAF